MKTINNDREFKKLMKGISLDKPSSGFSSMVMEAVYAEASLSKKAEPLLGMKFWIFVALFALLAILLIIVSGSGVHSESEITGRLLERFPIPAIPEAKGGFSRIMDSITGFPVTVGAIMIAASLLILADKVFGQKHHPGIG